MPRNSSIAGSARSQPPLADLNSLFAPDQLKRLAPESQRPSRWQQFPSTGTLSLLLLAITAIGAFLRFWRLGLQTYWTDEASTLFKIDTTFDNMLARVSDQGFPPGWYLLLRGWCLSIESHFHSATIAYSAVATRSLPALFGTLTLPAIYFLARQFTDRKGSLLVMLLAAVNPFLIYYSRDIKMYAALWFFVTLNMAIFFRWQTTHRHWLWFPLFAITGAAAAAMQSLAWFLIALQLIFLLTRPRLKSLDGPLWVLGVGLMAILPVYWFFNRGNWVGRVVDDGNAAGLDWIVRYTDMSWKTLASLPCAHLLGYLWPVYPPDYRVKSWFELGRDFNQHLATRSWPWMASAQTDVAIAVAAILLLGLLPWRGIRRSAERDASVTRGRWWWVALWILLPTVAFALTWIPDNSPWHNSIWHTLHPRPFWEPRYLGIIVPAWLLWLGASLRRLPTWPLRTLAITFVLAACTFSSLSNHLLYRNAPFDQSAQAAMKYYDRRNPRALAIGNPEIAYPQRVQAVVYDLAAKLPPSFEVHPTCVPPENFRTGLYSPNEYVAFVDQVKNRRDVTTLVLTDRFGDITAPADLLSDQSLSARLGPGWKLADEARYEWHYEWRFYIFHTWRTRVWQRQAPATTAPAANAPVRAPATLPATLPARAPTSTPTTAPKPQ